MRLNILGYTLTFERDIIKQVRRGSIPMLHYGPKVAMYDGTMYLCDTEGYIIPNQLDLSLSAPLNGPVTCKIECFISGIEPNPKIRNR